MTLLAKINYGSPETLKEFEDTTLKEEGRNKFISRKERIGALVCLAMGRKETVCPWPRDAEGYYFRSLAKKNFFLRSHSFL